MNNFEQEFYDETTEIHRLTWQLEWYGFNVNVTTTHDIISQTTDEVIFDEIGEVERVEVDGELDKLNRFFNLLQPKETLNAMVERETGCVFTEDSDFDCL